MVDEATSHGLLAILTLRETRRFVRERHGRMMTAFFAVVFALVSMWVGEMLILTPLHVTPYAGILWSPGTNPQWWNYPGILVVGGWGVLDLPFLPTWTMIFVSIGVGIGISAAVLLGVELVRMRRSGAARSTAIGSGVGLTPAMIALVTLGACCSTGAAAAAGIGAVAQTTGSTTYTLVTNSWYLSLFQVVVMGIALIAQEQLLFVTRGIFSRSGRTRETGAFAAPAPLDRSFALGALLRVALLIGGITWSLAMFADWIIIAPQSASAAIWFSWGIQYQLPALFAILVALFPAAIHRGLTRLARSWSLVLRATLLVAGLCLVAWVPPPISSWGIYGLGNEILGMLGLPAGWGAVVPLTTDSLTVALRWGFQYLLVGGFAIVFALLPARAFQPLEWSAGWMGAGSPSSFSTSLRSRSTPGPSARLVVLDSPASPPPATSAGGLRSP
ncbi:MAG: hypothetical protein HKL79_01770 [Thermoplasmata archaeon]|nr:hypothetical protein [Thermoplasmata archaeon]